MHGGVEGTAPESSLPTIEEGDDESTSMCDGAGARWFCGGRWRYRNRLRGTCHRNSKRVTGDERAGDGRVEEISEKEEMQDRSTEWQACGWGQDDLQEKDEERRGRELQMSTCNFRVLVG